MQFWFALLLLSATAPVPPAVEVIGQMTPAEPISEARIATLPKDQQPAWRAYLAKSQALMAADKAAFAAERAAAGGLIASPKDGHSGADSGMALNKPVEWYASAEARRVADNIVSYQTPAGGWGKNVDRTGPVRKPGEFWVIIENLPAYAQSDIQADSHWRYVGTIDNDATTAELRFLARVQAQLPGAEGEPYRAALLKGVRYLLTAQFPNGGWPQVFPLQGGYHDAITYNDDALISVVNTLSAVAVRKGDFAFVPEAVAAEARAACAQAVALILKTQVVVDGKRTIWGQQHDALTLAPVGARNFEPVALSSSESTNLLLFLMKQPMPQPELRSAVSDGVDWLKAHALSDVEWTRTEADGRKLVAKPGAGPLWSRFYDMRTGKPIFGDRDRAIHTDVNDISRERRNGYSWFNTSPAKAITAFGKWEWNGVM